MQHPILDQHAIIAWDMDRTLVDHDNAEYWREYIRAHPEKEHHIITFRFDNDAQYIPEELENWGLDPNLISSISNCPHHLSVGVALVGQPAVLLEYYNITSEQVEHAKHAFPRWKGARAKELGCTVLIDDMPEAVVMGCIENEIVFVHSHDPV